MIRVDLASPASAAHPVEALHPLSPKVSAIAEAFSANSDLLKAIGGSLKLSAFPFISVLSDTANPNYFDLGLLSSSPSQGSLAFNGTKIPFVAFKLEKNESEETVGVLYRPSEGAEWKFCSNKKDVKEFSELSHAFDRNQIQLIQDLFSGKGFKGVDSHYTMVDSSIQKRGYFMW
jgi:hypothetical protein